jgi:type IV pilus assembly protein PilC
MATAAKSRASAVKEVAFLWEGKNRDGKLVRGEMRAASESVVQAKIRRQGITNTKVKKVRFKSGSKITEKDIALFTRQLATMMKSGVPLLQAFDIVGRGHSNPTVGKLLLDIKADVETGSSLSQAFRKFPLQFDALYCNLVRPASKPVFWTRCWTIGDLQRKNHRHQEQDQVSACFTRLPFLSLPSSSPQSS